MHVSKSRNCGLDGMHIELQLYWYHNPVFLEVMHNAD